MHYSDYSGQDAKGVKRKAVGPREHEDLEAGGRQNCSSQVIPGKMLEELRGKLRAFQNMKTWRPGACRIAVFGSFWARC